MSIPPDDIETVTPSRSPGAGRAGDELPDVPGIDIVDGELVPRERP
ncbi:hypothetical protein [Microbacterium rhizomatis]|nr:hypothetical protein [Microbacterium rhizomatis]